MMGLGVGGAIVGTVATAGVGGLVAVGVGVATGTAGAISGKAIGQK